MCIVKVGIDRGFPDAFLLLTLYENSAPARGLISPIMVDTLTVPFRSGR